MANYDNNEGRVETGDVALTVEIRGAGEVWRYTNSDGSVRGADAVEYQPVPLAISNVKADGAMTGDQIDLRLPRGVPLADRFFPTATRVIYRVIIRQCHHVDGLIQEAPLMFTGVIIAAAVSGDDGEVLRLKLSTQMGLLNRSGLRRRYQIQCPHLLYGSECRAVAALATFPADISAPAATSFDDVYITIHGGDPDQPWMWRERDLREAANRQFLVGSTVQFGGASYDVVSQRLVASDIPRPTVVGLRVMPAQVQAIRDAVMAASQNDRVCSVIPSCDHTLACCNGVFSNGQNYGGQPWIPYENPVNKIFVGM